LRRQIFFMLDWFECDSTIPRIINVQHNMQENMSNCRFVVTKYSNQQHFEGSSQRQSTLDCRYLTLLCDNWQPCYVFPIIHIIQPWYMHIMLRDLLTQKCSQKTVTDFGYPRACRFRKYQKINRSWSLPLPTFFKTWFVLHKMWLKLEKIDQKLNFWFFLKNFIC
jgi:hypothetical protein